MSKSISNEKVPESTRSRSRVENFVHAWNSDRTPFSAWIERVSVAYHTSRLKIQDAAHATDAREMELWAVLRLATLEEDSLALLSGAPPPRTTWLHLADCDRGGIEIALVALEKLDAGQPPGRSVRQAIEAHYGPTASVAVAELSSTILFHMAKKVEQYLPQQVWPIKFLKSVAQQKRRARPLTPLQAAKLREILEKLADDGVIKRNSPDRDVAECNAVLDALGRGK